MAKRKLSDEAGGASKGVLVFLGAAIVLVLGIAILGIGGGIYYYTHKKPAVAPSIQPSASNANNIAPPTPTPTPTPAKKKRR